MFSPIKRHPWRSAAIGALAAGAVATGCILALPAANADPTPDNSANTTTPIKHVVVLFDENVSFDHYFGTYPNAANTDGVPFIAAPGTPTDIDTLQHPTDPADKGKDLLNDNPNMTPADPSATPPVPAAQSNPVRLPNSEALTTSQNHNYGPEQLAVDNGAMDAFPANTNSGTKAPNSSTNTYSSASVVMDYFDGNTATAEWNYAQNYAMSDNSWDATFGPSTVGALNLVSGNTAEEQSWASTTPTTGTSGSTPLSTTIGGVNSTGTNGNAATFGTVVGDPDPVYDDCADTNHTGTNALASISGQNIGDLLNAKGVSWGWFQGGFAPTRAYNDSHLASGQVAGYAYCGQSMTNIQGNSQTSYSPHHDPFEYYKSTSNPHHLPPANISEVGHDGQANHQYDLSYFYDAISAGNLPAVSYLKAPQAQDGHPGNSDPIDEQKFLTKAINAVEESKYWPSTAIVIAYDDSDGWYDHVAPTITNSSDDTLSGSSGDQPICTNASTAGVPELAGQPDRCGPSQRIPMLVISPYSKQNYVDHTQVTQPSILQFIEDNWSTGRVGNGSFDASAGSIDGMFDWNAPQQRAVLLNADGSVAQVQAVKVPASTGDQTSAPAPTVTVTAQPGTLATATGLSANGTTQSYGSTGIHLSAQVTGGTAPVGGSVAFLDGSKTLATVPLAGGVAGYTLPKTFAVGAHQISAKFSSSASSSADSASGTLKVTVAKAKSTTALAYRKGRITVSVKAPGVTVSGSAKVYDGTKVVKTAKLTKGKASFAVKLKKGTHKLHAVFATTKTVAGSTSATISVKIAK